MLDIKLFRENPQLIRDNITKKFQDKKLPMVDEVIEYDRKIRELQKESQDLRAQRNRLSQDINKAKKEGKSAATILTQAKAIPGRIADIEAQVSALEEKMRERLMVIPNIIHESVPIGRNDKENVEVQRFGEPGKFDFEVKSHVDIVEQLDIADFETSAETSGNGFYYLKGELALLNMALINYARDYMVRQGYIYVEPPLMIRKRVLEGVYSNEEIADMSYKIQDEDLYLIATSEHPLIGMFIGKTLKKTDLPLKITGFSACFRKEIGSHGIDEKGLYRTHQFNKQEMIVICEPEDSYKLYREMMDHSIAVFKGLGLPIRELECCSGDLADLKAKSADLEVWSPRKDAYFEITSCTNMEEAQARRLGIRIDDGHGNKYFAHTLNNTVIATSRAMVAILENFQNADGTVNIPEALQPYMGGKKVIGK